MHEPRTLNSCLPCKLIAFMSTAKYYLSALSAFIIWGFFSLALKPLHNYPSLDILFYRVFLCAVIMSIITLVVRRRVLRASIIQFKELPQVDKQRTLFLTLSGGILLLANWFFFIFVMNHISVKAASFAYLVCPILTTVIAYFVLSETLSRWQWFAVLLSLVSCLLLSFNSLKDVLFSMIVAVSYALYLVSQRKNNGFDKFLILSIQMLFSAIVLLPFYPTFSGGIPTEPFFYGMITIIAIVFTIVPLFLNLFALEGINSSTIGILLYINPLINFFMALLYYHEPINELQLIAYSLIFTSVVVFNERHFFKKRRNLAVS